MATCTHATNARKCSPNRVHWRVTSTNTRASGRLCATFAPRHLSTSTIWPSTSVCIRAKSRSSAWNAASDFRIPAPTANTWTIDTSTVVRTRSNIKLSSTAKCTNSKATASTRRSTKNSTTTNSTRPNRRVPKRPRKQPCIQFRFPKWLSSTTSQDEAKQMTIKI